MAVFKTALQSILLAAIPKSVGSLFRIWDDWKAPKDVRKSTIQRESLLLGLTVLFTSIMRPLMLKPLISKLGPQIAKQETGLNVLAAILGISAAEVASRLVAPKQPWAERFGGTERLERDDWDEDDFWRDFQPWQEEGKDENRLNVVSPGITFAQSKAPFASALPVFYAAYGNPLPVSSGVGLSMVRNMFRV